MLLCSPIRYTAPGDTVAITIRNKETEAMIRRIGKRRNEGPSATVRRLAEQELAGEMLVSEEEYDRTMRAFEELARKYPPPAEKLSWAELKAERDALYEYLDEEPARPVRKESV
jgi:hypothetical protein